MIDSRSVKTTEGGGVCGHDAGKKVAGRKRHIITDTPGCMLFIIVHSAAIQDRDGAVDLMKTIRYRSPWRVTCPRISATGIRFSNDFVDEQRPVCLRDFSTP